MKSTYAAIFVATLILVAGGVEAQTHLDASAIDQAVISKLSAQFGINSKVVTHLDLKDRVLGAIRAMASTRFRMVSNFRTESRFGK